MNPILGFINGSSSAYFTQYGMPLVDEDLAMAFDAALIYAGNNSDASMAESIAAGKDRILSFAI